MFGEPAPEMNVRVSGYEVDMLWRDARLVVELDGSAHHDPERDTRKTNNLMSQGWTVLRFWNDDVLRDLDNVCQHIVIAAGLTAHDARAQAAGRTLGVQS